MVVTINVFRYVARCKVVGTCRRFKAKMFPSSWGYQVLEDPVISTIRGNTIFPYNFSWIPTAPFSTP